MDKTPGDVKRLLEAERAGQPFLLFADGDQRQRLYLLDSNRTRLLVGRDAESDVCLGWDETVSGLHAYLEHANNYWMLHDDGISRNGSFINGERIHGHRILRDRDELRFGRTVLTYREPGGQRKGTVLVEGMADQQALSPAQRRVLIALCRPYKHRAVFARPATNKEIAEELVVSVEAVKSHMRGLFSRFGLEDAPQSEKRVRLVEQAFELGIVQQHEL